MRLSDEQAETLRSILGDSHGRIIDDLRGDPETAGDVLASMDPEDADHFLSCAGEVIGREALSKVVGPLGWDFDQQAFLESVVRDGFSDILEAGGFKIKNRVRGGGTKIQRKKRVAGRKGWTYDAKKRRSRKIDAKDRHAMSRRNKRSAIKARAKRSTSKIKRQKSNRIRKGLGFDK